MIQLAHAAAGAIGGSGADTRFGALLAGLASHATLDVVPHGEVHDARFEAVTGAAALAIIVLRRGPSSPMTWGAVGGLLPDLEHVLPRVARPRRALFPTHRHGSLHGWEGTPLAIPAWLQAVIGGAVVGSLVARRRGADRQRGTYRQRDAVARWTRPVPARRKPR